LDNSSNLCAEVRAAGDEAVQFRFEFETELVRLGA
jgi:hypothetical protein